MMFDQHKPERDPDRPTVFQIRIQGYLGQQWQGWFEGLTITLEEDGNTLLNGPIVDQSALHGILKKIRNLGMPLLAVNAADPNNASRTDIDQASSDNE
jgi:hypothetical protein